VHSLTSSWLGHGTGTNTGAARYAIDRPELFFSIENFYAKVAFELGIAGLLLVCVLFAVLIWQGWKAQKKIQDAGLRSCAASLTAFLIVLTLYSFKGSFIDLDPLNVYFWLFAGLLARLPTLDPRAGFRDIAAVRVVRRSSGAGEAAYPQTRGMAAEAGT
jgi:O-antigen ligase